MCCVAQKSLKVVLFDIENEVNKYDDDDDGSEDKRDGK